ncbi:hypothetical protein FISHEDRAFT_69852 [Fistulina hepatica ATCC 64428]|uniref:Uncharacterized protein n=1 Tax=Fistulina hepatica ATCC 64428 TaxID=1128425 RepID=A0A0D7ANS3_9AGAR|nr:hypothetical protein FISHEDRAFT_69852 [Fistulina hepatica ATCC 64428]
MSSGTSGRLPQVEPTTQPPVICEHISCVLVLRVGPPAQTQRSHACFVQNNLLQGSESLGARVTTKRRRLGQNPARSTLEDLRRRRSQQTVMQSEENSSACASEHCGRVHQIVARELSTLKEINSVLNTIFPSTKHRNPERCTLGPVPERASSACLQHVPERRYYREWREGRRRRTNAFHVHNDASAD